MAPPASTRGGPLLQALRRLDGYPKTLEEFRVRTRNGGLLSLVGIALVLVLAIRELVLFTSKEAVEDVMVDKSLGESLRIEMDITFPRITCPSIALQAFDETGDRQTGNLHILFKLALDENGLAVGHAEHQSSPGDTITSQGDIQNLAVLGGAVDDPAANRKPNAKPNTPECGSCYGPGDSGPSCCNSCEDVKAAFRSRGWKWSDAPHGSQRFWQCNGGKTPLATATGCQIFGHLEINKAKGSFHFAPNVRASDALAAFFGFSERFYDVSHSIHSLWFGSVSPATGLEALSSIDSRRDLIGYPPLDHYSKDMREASVVQYYIKVISTVVMRSSGENVTFYQYSAHEHIRPVPQSAIPMLHFFYDMPPLLLRFTEKPKPWGHFLTNLCALLGGTITLVGIVDFILYRNKIKLL